MVIRDDEDYRCGHKCKRYIRCNNCKYIVINNIKNESIKHNIFNKIYFFLKKNFKTIIIKWKVSYEND